MVWEDNQQLSKEETVKLIDEMEKISELEVILQNCQE